MPTLSEHISYKINATGEKITLQTKEKLGSFFQQRIYTPLLNLGKRGWNGLVQLIMSSQPYQHCQRIMQNEASYAGLEMKDEFLYAIQGSLSHLQRL